MLNRLYSHAQKSYEMDFRSLALFRILIALVILSDLAQRFGMTEVHYSDSGVLPRTSAIPLLDPDRWSLLFLNGSPEFSRLFVLIGMVAAGLMMVGWHTRASTIVLWVVVVSLQARNNHVTYGADTLMRLALFWSMFLPLGVKWSFDSKPYTNSKWPSISNFATFGLLIMNSSVYVFTALLKNGNRWREEYDAVYLSMGMRDLSTGIGDWIFRNAPESIFTPLTAGTLWMEFTIPILLLLPIRSDWLRMVAIAMVATLHLGIGTTLSVGLFPAMSIACILVVLPTNAWVYVENASLVRNHIGSRAIVRHEHPVPDRGYVVSDPQAIRFLPTTIPNKADLNRTVSNSTCAFAIVLGLLWNISTVSSFTIPNQLRRPAVAAGLYQNWAMFAPNPRAATVWFVLEGETASGQKVDLLQPLLENDFTIHQPPEWDQSHDVQLRNERWRKYFHAIRSRENDELKLAGYICRTWNNHNQGEDRLEKVTFTVVSATTLPNSERGDPVKQQVGTWFCS